MNCVRHISRMFSQSIATSQQSRNGQIVSTWPNRLHTSHSACGQCFSEWPISSHVLHWWYGQSDALLVLCLLELQAEHSLSGQLASLCPCCSHKLQSSASGQFCSECPISSHVLHWWYGQSDDLLVLCRLELHAEHTLSGQVRFGHAFCFFDRALHLCIPCNNWGNLYIGLRDLRSYSDCKPSRRGREMQNLV